MLSPYCLAPSTLQPLLDHWLCSLARTNCSHHLQKLLQSICFLLGLNPVLSHLCATTNFTCLTLLPCHHYTRSLAQLSTNIECFTLLSSPVNVYFDPASFCCLPNQLLIDYSNLQLVENEKPAFIVGLSEWQGVKAMTFMTLFIYPPPHQSCHFITMTRWYPDIWREADQYDTNGTIWLLILGESEHASNLQFSDVVCQDSR